MEEYMILKGDEVVGTATTIEKAEEIFDKTKVSYRPDGKIKNADRRAIIKFETIKED